MQPITYLCFTLLSILMQFCLMDFIQNDRMDNNTLIDYKINALRNVSEVLDKIHKKPHALYYRTEANRLKERTIYLGKNYNNSSVSETTFSTSTELASTVFDLLYDENVSMTDTSFTTETFSTSSDYDNVTEIAFFDQKTTIKPPQNSKKSVSRGGCACNLLYNSCDINCCCDNDCSDKEIELFHKCTHDTKDRCKENEQYRYLCSSALMCGKYLRSNLLENLFCIEKTNLPTQRYINDYKINAFDINKSILWHNNYKDKSQYDFSKELYSIGRPVWILLNGTYTLLEIPSTGTNDYCNGKKAIKFLYNDVTKCYVKTENLHMFTILKSIEHANIISPTENTINSTIMNCTNLYCIHWDVMICDDDSCVAYIKDLHEPVCSDSFCDNIAFKIQYIFNCNESTIVKATLKFYVTRVSINQQFVRQEILVNFYFGNNSTDKTLKLSGNPGYIKGLPVIASYRKSNHSKHFFNQSEITTNLILPHNKNGQCVLGNLTHNIVKFGQNKRMKCRLTTKEKINMYNGTDGCLKIQTKVIESLGLNKNIFISPYGNPQNIDDEYWISLREFNKTNVYGEYRQKSLKLLCYNLITGVTFIFAFGDIKTDTKEGNKIVSAQIVSTSKNITFTMDHISAVVTMETIFIDITKPEVQEYAGAPDLNIYLPRDFFLPLPSNKGAFVHPQLLLTFNLYVVIVYKKIK